MSEFEKIEKIVVEITTCSDRKSDTNDAIILYVGGHEWALDLPYYDDFEKGKTDVFDLDIPEGMNSSQIRYFCLKKKSHTNKDDDWCLSKIKVTINDKVIYERDKIHHWLKDNELSWCAPDFTYGQAGE
ncbi:MAG: hypothetical protein EAX90_09990 [Candidatus Heimdallarchaeota archaeon]|nr:hypothetical protein [Candidatus Heimdallarchaeota archaeon]